MSRQCTSSLQIELNLSSEAAKGFLLTWCARRAREDRLNERFDRRTLTSLFLRFQSEGADGFQNIG
jgi:hypothetical protein